MDPNYLKKFFATQIQHAVEETIKEILRDLRSGMKIPEIEKKWAQKL